MRKKVAISLILCVLVTGTFGSVYARDMNIYVNGHHLIRDVQTVGKFDMLPILDIAGELGFKVNFDNYTACIYNDNRSYSFRLGDAVVSDNYGNRFGLDVVPQILNGKFMIPAKFFQDVMLKSYVWDDVTDTVFLGSENEYNWLINTDEYKRAKNIQSYNIAAELFVGKEGTKIESVSGGVTNYAGTVIPDFSTVTGEKVISEENVYMYVAKSYRKKIVYECTSSSYNLYLKYLKEKGFSTHTSGSTYIKENQYVHINYGYDYTVEITYGKVDSNGFPIIY